MSKQINMPTVEERFWSKVDKTDSCWIWVGGRMSAGYGTFTSFGRNILPHRYSYKLFKGDIPEGKQIDHLCRNTICVNPNHLEAVTQKENLLRGVGICAQNSRKTHCIHGHEFTKENTRFITLGRQCKECCKNNDLKRRKKLLLKKLREMMEDE